MLALESYQELVKVKNKRSWKDFEAYLILCFVSRVNYEKLGAWRQSPDLEIQFCLRNPTGKKKIERHILSVQRKIPPILNFIACEIILQK